MWCGWVYIAVGTPAFPILFVKKASGIGDLIGVFQKHLDGVFRNDDRAIPCATIMIDDAHGIVTVGFNLLRFDRWIVAVARLIRLSRHDCRLIAGYFIRIIILCH